MITPAQSRDLFLLAQLRKHPHFGAIAGNVEFDRECGLMTEDYPGEDRDRRDGLSLLLELLRGES